MDSTTTPRNPSPFTGMSELWQLAWALQGLTRAIDVEDPADADTPFERDRLSGLRTAAHMLSGRLLEFADAFNEVMTPRHDEALARIAKETGETPAEVAAGLLCMALDDIIASREADEAADQAREERIRAARLQAKETILAAVEALQVEEGAA
ncbi:MAG: hypothetical protein EOM91_15555 [Sphingobacteriia bacterium]|nr:hypothetical protein [Sphingobacteriia bacterium]